MRSRALNFASSAETWNFTVRSERFRCAPISLFDSCRSTHCSTSPSRAGHLRAVADGCPAGLEKFLRALPNRIRQAVARHDQHACSRRASALAPRNASPEGRRPIRPAPFPRAWPAPGSASHPRRAHKKQTLLAARCTGVARSCFRQSTSLGFIQRTLAIEISESVRGGERKVRLYEG